MKSETVPAKLICEAEVIGANFELEGATLIRPAQAVGLCILEEVDDDRWDPELLPPGTLSVLLFDRRTIPALLESLQAALSDLEKKDRST